MANLISRYKKFNSTAMFAISLRCTTCGRRFPLGTIFSCKHCGGCLSVDYDYNKLSNLVTKELIRKGNTLIKKYRWFLPIKEPKKAITLYEGNTPLLRCKRLGNILRLKNLYAKDETRNPTGTFKDRAIAVGVSYANERGVNKVTTASTGNAAAALAAYAAKARMDSMILIPGEISTPKLFQILTYGARIKRIQGTVDNALGLLRRLYEEDGWYPIPTSAPINPYQFEGNKTIAYEICQQQNWTPPDWVIIPMGGGDCISANWKGFQEFYNIGLINNLPSLIGVQARGCNPIVRAFKRKTEEIKPIDFPKTIAHSILVRNPPTGPLALKAILQSKGVALDVTDDEIIAAQKLLGSMEGIFAEPASSATIAALKKLTEEGRIDKNDHIICVITGSGLKQPEVLSLAYQDEMIK